MSDISTLNGSLLLNTDPSARATPLSVSRSDVSIPGGALAQITLFGSGPQNAQGVIAFRTMNSGTVSGPLQERMRIHTDGNVWIAANLTVGAGGNASIRVRHIDGKHDQNDDADALHLNWNTGKPVYVGREGKGSDLVVTAGLTVAGDVVLGGKHAFRGNDAWLRLNQDGQFGAGVHTPGNFAPGRLNVGGAYGWGDPGAGNAWISGNLTVGAGANAAILVRHINGKSHVSDDSDPLFLNWNTGKAVYVGGDQTQSALVVNGDLSVAGDLALGGKHAFRGNDAWLRLNQDGQFGAGVHTPGNFAPGRLNVGGAYGLGDPGAGNAWISGNLTVGAGANAAILVRHINGKHYVNDDFDPLFLNWDTGRPVYVGRDEKRSDLIVSGNLFAASGQFQVDEMGRLGTRGHSPTPIKDSWGGGIHTWDVEAEGTMWSAHGYKTGAHDLAENYVSDDTLEAGDVVSLRPGHDGILRSSASNDSLVLGVISTTPGFLLNDDHQGAGQHFPVALCGRVPCKVVNENGPIRKGDLLTSSSLPGHAMKAAPIPVDGQALYRPGTIIGKALEDFTGDTGTIEIFVFSG